MAEVLCQWLPAIINAVNPWMSKANIEKGARWASELAAAVEEARVGVICLTPSNVDSPWILFEAGALSKTLADTFVCPYLIDLSPAELKGPLAQFQATRAEKEDTRNLVHTINRALGAEMIREDQLNRVFDLAWPEIEKDLRKIPVDTDPRKNAERSDREILEELVLLARSPGISSVQGRLDESQADILRDLKRTLENVSQALKQVQYQNALNRDVERAINLLQGSNALAVEVQQSISDLEIRMRDEPLDRKLNIVLARMYAEQTGNRARAIDVLTEYVDRKTRKGEGTDRDTADALYNIACYYSLESEKSSAERREELKQKALKALEQSLKLHPNNVLGAVEDADLSPIREMEEFTALVRVARQETTTA